ncbi:MAG: SpoIIE family protein phosphatase [Pyrinomonadaceae bacterium]|nr:SpoIIE family protein phosphatase [Pyrinomonadaceae bacterium]
MIATESVMESVNPNILGAPGARALIADDQPDIVTALRLLLRGAGYQTEGVNSPAAVLEAIKQRDFDLVLMDLNYARDTTSGQEGLELITHIRAFDSTLPVMVLTAWGSVELAVEAMHRGVRDFVLKPWDNSELLKSVRTQIELGRRRRQRRRMNAARQTINYRLQQELTESQEIQEALLPKDLPQIDGIEIAVSWQPARAVGGDYFDVLKFDDRHSAICIADAAGKGMPAALLMSNVQAVLKSFASAEAAPYELCGQVNRVMCQNMVPHRFISCFYGLLDTQTRKLSYANAGHCPPMLARGGTCLRLKEGGPVLGIFPDRHYLQGEIELSVGDTLVFFTDGVTEARDASGEEFGEERLQELLTLGGEFSARELRDLIMAAVGEFSDGPVQDDATLMVLKVD